MEIFDYYLLGINGLGFFLFIINTLLYKYTANKQIDIVVTICSIIGGSLGIALGILFFEKKTEKEVMMSRVFVNCMLIIQVIIVLFIKGVFGDSINLKFWELFTEHKFLIWYLIAINVVTIIMFAKDKIASVEKKWRIKIITLLALCFAGGSIGGLIGMYVFHHKTKKDYFKIGIPLIMIMHVFIILYLINI